MVEGGRRSVRGVVQSGREALRDLRRAPIAPAVIEEALLEKKLRDLGMTGDQLFDADERLARVLGKGLRYNTVFVPPGDSVHRLDNPLTPEQEANFGDVALRAVRRTDLDPPEPTQSSKLE